MIVNSSLCEKLLGDRSDPIHTVSVEVSQYIRITKVSQSIGVFPLSLVPSQKKITLAIGKVISIVLSKQVEITFTSRTEWTINDGKGKQWVIAFHDPRDADKTLAVLGLLYSVTDTNEPAFYDAKKADEGIKPISLPDTVKMNYRCFSLANFPSVDRLVVSRDAMNAKLRAKKLPKALAENMVGMAPGATRVIFLPEVTDKGWPSGSFVFVVDVLKVRYGDADQPEPEADDDDESIAPASAPPPEPSPRQEISAPEPEDEPEDDNDEDEPAEQTEEDREAQEKADRIRRMQRLGAVAGPIVPIMPKPAPKPVVRQEEREPEPAEEPVKPPPKKVTQPPPEPKKVTQPPPEPKKTPPVPKPVVPQKEVTVAHLEERLEHLAKTVETRLDAMCQPRGMVDVDSVISGITALAVQARSQLTEIDQLTKILEDVKSKNAGSSFAAQQMESVRQELEDKQRKATLLDKKVKDGNRKLRELEKTMLEASKRAKEQGGMMIKALMSNVFDDMTTAFEEDGRYTGQEVRDQLYELLRKHSFSMMKQVEKQGII